MTGNNGEEMNDKFFLPTNNQEFLAGKTSNWVSTFNTKYKKLSMTLTIVIFNHYLFVKRNISRQQSKLQVTHSGQDDNPE